MSLKGVFIVGTDTGVGKTLVGGALCAALSQQGIHVVPMKPVETGCPVQADALLTRPHSKLDRNTSARRDRPYSEPIVADSGVARCDAAAVTSTHAPTAPPSPAFIPSFIRHETGIGPHSSNGIPTPLLPDILHPSDALFLRDMANSDADLDLINPYRYAPPLAPALAAKIAQRPIVLDLILERMHRLQAAADLLVVEGAGGILVPLTEDALLIDLLARTRLPALVIARSALGTINHTLLTVSELRRRGIPLAGVILNRVTKPTSPDEAANPEQIERFAGAIVLGVLPWFDSSQRANREYLGQRFSVHVDVGAILRAADSTG